MKRLLTYVFILGGVMLAALSGCQKEEVAPAGNEKAIASFYEANTSNTIVQKLAKNLSEQPDAQQKAQVLYQTYGKPLWDKAKIVANAYSLQVLVPMEEVGYKHLTAIWGFDVKEEVISYNFLENEQSSPLYPKLGWLFPAMEQEIYKTSPNGKRYVRQGHLKTNVIMQMSCYEVWVDYGKGSEYSYTDCYSSGVWIYDTPSGNGGTIPQTSSDYVPPHGNGNSNPTLPDRDPDPDPEVDDPCAKIKVVSIMPGLSEKLTQLLNDARSLNYETSYLVNNRYNYTYQTGPIGDCKVPVNVSTYTVSIIHSHPGMCGNIFSPGDIKVIWDLCKGDAIEKTSFQLGLVTSTGNKYFLSVSDYSKFEAYANKWNMSSDDISGLNKSFESYYNEAWSSSMLESNFLDFIKDAGLRMLKGDGNNWHALQKDASGNVTNTPCNN